MACHKNLDIIKCFHERQEPLVEAGADRADFPMIVAYQVPHVARHAGACKAIVGQTRTDPGRMQSFRHDKRLTEGTSVSSAGLTPILPTITRRTLIVSSSSILSIHLSTLHYPAFYHFEMVRLSTAAVAALIIVPAIAIPLVQEVEDFEARQFDECVPLL